MNDLKYGVEGYSVMLMQYALSRAGMESVRPDGIFGRRTARVLQEFQREQGLAADGIAGKLTWAALYPYISGYTLQRITAGDTLFQLAKRYNTSMQALQIANPALAPDKLPVGYTMVVPFDLPVVADAIPYSSLLTGIILRGLTMRYPFLSLYEIGRSVIGRRIMAVSMGNGLKTVGYNGAHHANEWITVPLLVRFLEEYAAAFAHDGTIGGVSAREMYETATLHIVPLVNPDGVDLVTGALSPFDSFYTQASALASYYPNIPFPDGWKSNITGVDLNLQYPAGWEIARRNKFDQGYTRPGPRDYAGSSPLITPESQAMARWTKANDFSLIMSYHTQGRSIQCQYGSGTVSGAKEIGAAISQSSGYTLESMPFESGHAGYTDWFIQNYGRPGFTIRVGQKENPIPLSRLEEIYRENLPILVRGIILSP